MEYDHLIFEWIDANGHSGFSTQSPLPTKPAPASTPATVPASPERERWSELEQLRREKRDREALLDELLRDKSHPVPSYASA